MKNVYNIIYGKRFGSVYTMEKHIKDDAGRFLRYPGVTLVLGAFLKT